MRAGTLQLHDGKVARAARACVRGPLVAESCVTGRSLNFPPGAALLRPSGAPSLQGQRTLLAPAVHITGAHLFTTNLIHRRQGFCPDFCKSLACRQKWWRADLKGLQLSLVWGTHTGVFGVETYTHTLTHTHTQTHTSTHTPVVLGLKAHAYTLVAGPRGKFLAKI